MTDLDALIALSERLGGGVAVFGLLALIIALQRKYLVFGWVYAECVTNRDQCTQGTAARATKMEAELDDLRKERLRHERA